MDDSLKPIDWSRLPPCPACGGTLMGRVIRPTQTDVWCVGRRDDGKDRCGWRKAIHRRAPSPPAHHCAECAYVLTTLAYPKTHAGPYR